MTGPEPGCHREPARRRTLLLGLGGAALGVFAGSCGSPVPAPDARIPAEVRGRVLHVDPAGRDGADGSEAAPWRHLATALRRLRAGDRLVVGGGEYVEDVDVPLRAGTAAAPVVVVAGEGQRPVLRGLLRLSGASWWSVSGLDVTWNDGTPSTEHMVKITDGHDWEFTDAELWGARSYAALLVAGTPRAFRVARLHVHDTRPSNGTNQDHLVYLNCGSGGGVVEDCLLADSPNGRAVKIGPATRSGSAVSGVVLRHNTMIANLGPSNVQLAWDTSGVVVERNILVSPADGRANVTAFSLTGRGNVVRDNVGWNSSAVVQPDTAGLDDGGGNLLLDPRLTTVEDRDAKVDLLPRDPTASHYGAR